METLGIANYVFENIKWTFTIGLQDRANLFFLIDLNFWFLFSFGLAVVLHVLWNYKFDWDIFFVSCCRCDSNLIIRLACWIFYQEAYKVHLLEIGLAFAVHKSKVKTSFKAALCTAQLPPLCGVCVCVCTSVLYLWPFGSVLRNNRNQCSNEKHGTIFDLFYSLEIP